MKYQKARNKKAEPKHIPECGECVRSEGYKIVSSQQAETSKHSSKIRNEITGKVVLGAKN